MAGAVRCRLAGHTQRRSRELSRGEEQSKSRGGINVSLPSMSDVAAEGGNGFEESVDDDLAVAAAVAKSYTIDGGDDSVGGKDEASHVAADAEEGTAASHNTNSSRSKSGKGGGRGGGSKVLELSAKTTKIMSAYQEYLSEIATEFPVEDDEEYYSAGRGDSGMDRAATTSVAAARDRVRESYENQMLLEEQEEEEEEEEESSYPSVKPSSYPSVKPGDFDLVRGWNYTHDGLRHSSPSGGVAIDRYGAGDYLGGGGGNIFADDMLYAMGRQRYVVHPCLRSKRVRRGICLMVAFFAILGISIGIARRNKDDDLQELEGMMDDAQSDASDPSHPIKFDRTTGWHGRTYTEALIFCGSRPGGYLICPYEAICPGGPDTEPLLGYATGGDANGDANGDFRSRWVPLLDGPNSWVQVGRRNSCIQYFDMHGKSPEWGINGNDNDVETQEIICCKADKFNTPHFNAMVQIDYQTMMFDAATKQFLPHMFDKSTGWEGTTYEAAETFCSSAIHGYGLCPYEGICPMGKDSEPIVSYQEGKNVWVPIIAPDAHHEFAQISANKPCFRYSDLYGSETTWPSGNTSFVTCCASPGHDLAQDEDSESGELTSTEDTSIYMAAAMTFLPKWYNRESGWRGSTYIDAIQFCSDSASNYELCPYYAICPLGLGSQPLGGYREEPSGSWVPFSDRPNLWVQTSGKSEFGGPCVPSEQVGFTGGVDEEIMTRHVACCVVSSSIDSGSTTDEAAGPTQTGTESSFAIEKYQPLWRDRSRGWDGQTYQEALEYCDSIGHYTLCPYVAICPMGPGHKPVSGSNEGSELKWVPILDNMNDWVYLSVQDGLQEACLPWSASHDALPEWGVTGHDNEELTRNIVCCVIQGTVTPTNVAAIETEAPPDTGTAMSEEQTSLMYQTATERYHPIWFNRSKGWHGQTSHEAFRFCLDFSNRIPCPYAAICPMGVGSIPLGGYKDEVNETWVPIGDAPNSWVLLSNTTSCAQYSHLYKDPPPWGETGEGNEEITRHIACCSAPPPSASPSATPMATPSATSNTPPLTEQEQAAMDFYNAKWYGRGEGYQGTTYAESVNFCNQIAGMKLCPLAAYCPSGPTREVDGRPLYLQQPAFEGEQWAPIASTNNDDDTYVLVGKISDNPTTTCHTYRDFNKEGLPQWVVDGSHPEFKEHILCCKDSTYVSPGMAPVTYSSPIATESPTINIQPKWLSLDDGWFGGSHADAEAFCNHLEGRQLCPYAAYCPLGPSQPVSSGHTTDISAEGEQWAPFLFGVDNPNHWVMVGQKDENSATTCYSHEELEGTAPEWGLTSDMPEIKKYIMCCVVN